MSAIGYLTLRPLGQLQCNERTAKLVVRGDDVLLKTYHLDVITGERTLNRFDVRFERADEAIQHSKDLAANFRRRHFPNHGGLVIAVIDQAGRKIHEEIVYREGEER